MKYCFVTWLWCISIGSFAQNKFSNVDDWLKSNLNLFGGRAVLMVYKDDKVAYSQAYNNVGLKQKFVAKMVAKKYGGDAEQMIQPFTITTRERIASCSKWLSAALVMTFVDERKLNLKDTVGKYLPIMSLHGKGSITISECLSHMTGILPAEGKAGIMEMASMNSMDDAMNKIALMPIEAGHVKAFRYSNVGLQMAAAVIEKISGKNFETLFQERIAQPCSMNNTDFGHKSCPLVAGGAFSTTEDYMQFLIMLLNSGKYKSRQVLSAKAIEAMQQNYQKGVTLVHSPKEAGNWGYGYGEWIMEEGILKANAVSSPGLFGTFPWIDNEQKYAAILFTFNLKSEGRHEHYIALKKLVDAALQ